MEQLDCFAGCNASAENVAKYIYDRIEPMLASRLKLDYAEVMEADGCWTKYCR
ncbi:MAG: 6-carboxytetrahydropterin synthase [Planctomycetes bacterium]|nr:6-carboxytetrahydropterin synthase [Planctomycetota bacterium]